MSGFITTRAQRRELERQNSKLPTTLRPVPVEDWPTYPDGASKKPYAVLRSRFFLVQCYQEYADVTRLSINRTEIDPATGRWKEGITWDELQEVKRQAGLGDYMAVEIFPADSDIVNVANMRHLWVLRDPLWFGWKNAPKTSGIKGGAA